MKCSVSPYALPLVAPLRTAAGSLRARRGLLVRLVGDGDSGVGFGEIAPPLGWGGEAVEALADDVDRFFGDWPESMDLWGALDVVEAAALPRFARAGLEMALLDLHARTLGAPVTTLLGGARRASVAVNALVGAGGLEAAVDEARAAVDAGFGTLKIKVGAEALAEDVARVQAVRAEVGDEVEIRLDANGAYRGLEAARAALAAFAPFGIAYIEDVAHDLDTLLAITGSPIPLAADGFLTDDEAIARVLKAPGVDVLVLKPSWIGLRRALEVGRRASEAGKTVVVTSVIEGSVGRQAALHVAACIDGLAGACGLATGSMLAADLFHGGAQVIDGVMAVGGASGLGVGPGAGASAVKVPMPLWHRARYVPERVAVECEGERLTYGALLDRADACAEWLEEAGIGRGDVVAVCSENAVEVVVAVHGVARLGAIVAPLHPRLTEGEADALIDAVGARVVLEWGVGAREGVESLDLASMPTCAGGAGRARVDRVTLGSPWARVATSGSAGAPKVVELGITQQLFSAMGSAVHLGHAVDDRWLAVLPLCHVGGLSILARCALLGTTVVLRRGFDAGQVAADLIEGRASLVSLVPTMLHRVLDALEGRPVHPRLRCVLLGGGPIPAPLLERARAAGLPVTPTYGLTEASSQVATGAPMTPLVFTEIAIEDADQGGVGRIMVRGATVTTSDDRPAGWYATGDFGRCAGEGLEVVGRRLDLIVTGGENVYPAEVEAVLLGCDGVEAACVVAVPDPVWGERVEAAVVFAPGADRDRIEDECRGRLAPHKAPRRLHEFDVLPLRGPGKVDRRAIAALIRLSATGR